MNSKHFRYSFSALCALALGGHALANTDSVTLTATKPSPVYTLAIKDTAGSADVTALGFGALTRDTVTQAGTLVELQVIYNNAGVDGDTISIAFTAPSLPTGYTLGYDLLDSSGAAVLSHADQALNTPYTAVLTSNQQGSGTVFMAAEGAEPVASSADAYQVRFQITAAGGAKESITSTMLIATVTGD